MRRHDVHLVFNQIESEKQLGNVQTVGKCDKMQNGTAASEKKNRTHTQTPNERRRTTRANGIEFKFCIELHYEEGRRRKKIEWDEAYEFQLDAVIH